MKHYRYLIVGGGMTADAAAHGIRELDPGGTLGIIGAEDHGPYNRPPLSKGLWKGEPESAIWRDTAATSAEMHLGRRVVGIDPVAKRVTDDAGHTWIGTRHEHQNRHQRPRTCRPASALLVRIRKPGGQPGRRT